MMQESLAEEDLLEADEDIDSVDALEDDAFSEIDELDESDALDAADEFEEVDEFEEADALADEFEDELEAEDAGDELDEFGDFAVDEASGLYLPTPRSLISGPAAVAVAQRLNPFVIESMDADDADAFFRRIRRGLRRIGSVAGRLRRVAGPLLRRALPMIQRVAGLAGPWGRLVSAGIGAARGLASGRGLRGALAGAVGGLVPGVGGRLASAILRADAADGLDDDGALDALADMADAGHVSPGVALPLGAGLAARVATPRVAGNITPAIARRAAAAERTMLRAGTALRGRMGRRLRLLRMMARLARRRLLRRRRAAGPGAAAGVLPSAAAGAARQIIRRARQQPALGASSPAAAARRTAARQRILRSVPLSAVYPRPGQMRAAA